MGGNLGKFLSDFERLWDWSPLWLRLISQRDFRQVPGSNPKSWRLGRNWWTRRCSMAGPTSTDSKGSFGTFNQWRQWNYWSTKSINVRTNDQMASSGDQEHQHSLDIRYYFQHSSYSDQWRPIFQYLLRFLWNSGDHYYYSTNSWNYDARWIPPTPVIEYYRSLKTPTCPAMPHERWTFVGSGYEEERRGSGRGSVRHSIDFTIFLILLRIRRQFVRKSHPSSRPSIALSMTILLLWPIEPNFKLPCIFRHRPMIYSIRWSREEK